MGDALHPKKDFWDKWDVILRGAGVVVVPLAVGWSVHQWNTSSSERQLSAQMSQIAVGILQQPPETSNKVLRSWAIEVLRSPSHPPALTHEAAYVLELEPLTMQQSKSYSLPTEDVAETIRKLIAAANEFDEKGSNSRETDRPQ